MVKQRSSPILRFTEWLFADPNPIIDESNMDFSNKENLVKAVNAAKSQWLTAKSYFDNISEPDLIDHAVYTLEAAERKYMFLLKKLKEDEYASS
ncbi:MAG: DUF2508 family protein [Firmicutes bacterium]|nr:DUF2508 family protein [Bacillota bacterium]